MANFEIPFANTGPRRNPTSDERSNGFPCGGADQLLFNGMFHRLEAEIGNVISFAGLVGTDTDFTQLRQAISALIAAATGGGEVEDYLLLSQARSRLPIFPDMQTADGTLNITSPANGTVRVPSGITFLHRGIFPVTTAQTDLITVSSRTYHLRWNPTDGFTLKNLGDSGYNPGTLPETDLSFDSTYDDMLIGRIVTNAGNVPTITSLANRAAFRLGYAGTATPTLFDANSAYKAEYAVPLNWARTPLAAWNSNVYSGSPGGSVFVQGGANRVYEESVTRYQAIHKLFTDWNGATSGLQSSARAVILA